MPKAYTSHRLAFLVALMGASAAIAACGGGGGGGSSVPGQTQTSGTASGQAVLTIPNRTATSVARKPAFLSASVSSVGVAVNGGTVSYSDVSATSALCSATSTGRTCTIPLAATGGSDTFVFTLFDAPNGGGNKLGTGTTTQTVTIGTAFTVAVAISGLPASVTLSVPAIEVGPTSVPVSVVVKDVDGNTIIGPTAYAAPIALTNSDTTGTLTLSTTTVNTPNDVVTLAYTGGALTSAATISAASAGVASTSVHPASVLPLNYFPVGISHTYASLFGQGGSFVPIGNSSPLPAYTAAPNPGSYTDSIVGGATFNGVSGLQADTIVDGGTLSLETGATTYQSFAAGKVAILGSTNPNCPPSTTTYPNGNMYAALPFVTGASLSSSPAFTFSQSNGTPCGYAESFVQTADASGNLTETFTESDASTTTLQANVNGSGSATFVAGQGVCSGGEWGSGLPCNLASAMGTVTAPSGGSVTLNVTQIASGGGTQTASLPIATSVIYPNGVPTSAFTVESTVGAPISSASAIPCPVTLAYQFPVIPVTYVLAQWLPVNAEYDLTTEVDYLAPSLGKICVVTTKSESFAEGLQDAAFSITPMLGPYVVTYLDTETDTLVSVGPAYQAGTVTTNANARSNAGERSIRGLRRRFLFARGGRLP